MCSHIIGTTEGQELARWFHRPPSVQGLLDPAFQKMGRILVAWKKERIRKRDFCQHGGKAMFNVQVAALKLRAAAAGEERVSGEEHIHAEACRGAAAAAAGKGGLKLPFSRPIVHMRHWRRQAVHQAAYRVPWCCQGLEEQGSHLHVLAVPHGVCTARSILVLAGIDAHRVHQSEAGQWLGAIRLALAGRLCSSPPRIPLVGLPGLRGSQPNEVCVATCMVPMLVGAQNSLERQTAEGCVVLIREEGQGRNNSSCVAWIDHAARKPCVAFCSGLARLHGGVYDEVAVVVRQARDRVYETAAPLLAVERQLRADVQVAAVISPSAPPLLDRPADHNVQLADRQGVGMLDDHAEPGHAGPEEDAEKHLRDLENEHQKTEHHDVHQEQERRDQVEQIHDGTAAPIPLLRRHPWRQLAERRTILGGLTRHPSGRRWWEHPH
mmetsp:Transcript_50438/g.163211  ORF Transcript_50438/g.163211 Transcript_50438/m.163211 type:complete len:437 (-) Transcript_50438:115-1425(-)